MSPSVTMVKLLENLNTPRTVIVLLALFLAADGLLLYVHQRQTVEPSGSRPARSSGIAGPSDPTVIAKPTATAPSAAARLGGVVAPGTKRPPQPGPSASPRHRTREDGRSPRRRKKGTSGAPEAKGAPLSASVTFSYQGSADKEPVETVPAAATGRRPTRANRRAMTPSE